MQGAIRTVPKKKYFLWFLSLFSVFFLGALPGAEALDLTFTNDSTTDCATLQECVAQVCPVGGTVFIGPGTFTNGAVLAGANVTGLCKELTIQGAGKDLTILIAEDCNPISKVVHPNGTDACNMGWMSLGDPLTDPLGGHVSFTARDFTVRTDTPIVRLVNGVPIFSVADEGIDLLRTKFAEVSNIRVEGFRRGIRTNGIDGNLIHENEIIGDSTRASDGIRMNDPFPASHTVVGEIRDNVVRRVLNGINLLFNIAPGTTLVSNQIEDIAPSNGSAILIDCPTVPGVQTVCPSEVVKIGRASC